MSIDLVYRFALTPIQNRFNLSGKVISLATNCAELLNRMSDFTAKCGEADQPNCSWRIVTEPEKDGAPESVAVNSRCVDDDGTSFVTISQRSFLAYDRRTRKGISFISEELVSDPTLFSHTFFPSFLSLLQEEQGT